MLFCTWQHRCVDQDEPAAVCPGPAVPPAGHSGHSGHGASPRHLCCPAGQLVSWLCMSPWHLWCGERMQGAGTVVVKAKSFNTTERSQSIDGSLLIYVLGFVPILGFVRGQILCRVSCENPSDEMTNLRSPVCVY